MTKKSLKIFKYSLVLGLYLVISLFMTIPLVFEMNTHIPNVSEDNDALQVYSKSYKGEYKIFDSSSNITDKVLYFIHPKKVLNTFSYLYLSHHILGQPIAYNIIWILSFVLSAFGTFLLVKYLTNNSKAAFLAGLIYSFSPYHFDHAIRGHYGATHIEFIPFFILFLLKYIKKPNIKYLLATGLFLILTVINEPHYAAFLFIFLVILLIYYYLNKRKLLLNKKFLKYTGISAIFGLAFVAFYYFPLLKVNYSGENYLKPPFSQVIKHSSDALGIITPSKTHPLLGDLFSGISSNFSDTSPFIGFAAIFFVILALLYKKNKLSFWVITAISFYILSLGPFLRFDGLIKPLIPMPHLLLYEYMPWFDNIRTVERLNVFFTLSVAVLVGYGISYFLKRFKEKNKIIVASIIAALFLFEYFQMPIKTTAVELPKFYQDISNSDEDYAILQVPGSTNYAAGSKFDYYKSVHGKEIIDGIDFARKVPGKWDFQYQTPVINSLLYSLPIRGQDQRDIIKHPYDLISNDLLNKYNIKYIVLDKSYVGNDWDQMSTAAFIKTNNFIENNIKHVKTVENEERIVYEISPGNKDSVYLQISDNWNPLKRSGYNLWRWSKDKSDIKINNLSDENKKIEVTLEAETSDSNYRRLEIIKDDKVINNYSIGPTKQAIKFYLDDIEPGESSIEFHISEIDDHTANTDIEKGVRFFNIAYKVVDTIGMPVAIKSIVEEKEDFSILSLPLISNYSFDHNPSNDHYIGNKKLITIRDFEKLNDYSIFDDTIPYDYKLPFINEFLFYPGISPKIITNFHDAILSDTYHDLSAASLDDKNIKYIIFHKEYYSEDNVSAIYELLENNDNFHKYYDDENLLIYRLKDINYNIIMHLDREWGKRTKLGSDNDLYVRNINTGSALNIINTANREIKATFSFRAMTYCVNRPRFLNVYFNDISIDNLIFTHDKSSHNFDITLNPGENKLTFDVFDEYGKMIDGDPKCSLQIREIDIK